MDVNSELRSKLLARIHAQEKEKEEWLKRQKSFKGNSPKLSKSSKIPKNSTIRHRFALRFGNLLASDMIAAKRHIVKRFPGVVGVKFLCSRKNQSHFNGWMFFNLRINLLMAASKIIQKKSRKLCYMNCIKTEINGFEREPLFPGKKIRVKGRLCKQEVVVIMKKFKKERKGNVREYKHWTLQTRNEKIV